MSLLKKPKIYEPTFINILDTISCCRALLIHLIYFATAL